VQKVVQHLTARVARECMVCGKSFEVRRLSRKRLCSPECFKEHRRRLRKVRALRRKADDGADAADSSACGRRSRQERLG
jgi:hypothetical protein